MKSRKAGLCTTSAMVTWLAGTDTIEMVLDVAEHDDRPSPVCRRARCWSPVCDIRQTPRRPWTNAACNMQHIAPMLSRAPCKAKAFSYLFWSGMPSFMLDRREFFRSMMGTGIIGLGSSSRQRLSSAPPMSTPARSSSGRHRDFGRHRDGVEGSSRFSPDGSRAAMNSRRAATACVR
jgi:hypothetical protein